MKTIFLISDIGTYKKINGERICPIDNRNGLVQQLKKSVKNRTTLVFIASSPSAYETNDTYAKILFESFALSGIEFKNLVVIDDRNKNNLESIIENADLIFLAGGHVPTQNEFINEIGLKSLLNNYNGVILGQSAGAMNLAELVYNYPEDESEISEVKIYKGLCQTNLGIIPHFDVTNFQKNDETDITNSWIKEQSMQVKLYGIPDGSYIVCNENGCNFYGDIHIICNGKIFLTSNINAKNSESIKNDF